MDCNEPNAVLDYLSLPCMSYEEVLTGVFLKISISNYLAIFSVRTKNMFFMSFPGTAVACASILALISTTLISKYWNLNLQPINGVVVASLSPVSWKIVFVIWVFDFTIFVVQDFVKVAIFKGFEQFRIKSQNHDLTQLLLAETFLNCKHKSRYICTQKETISSC
jgi:H+-transporting ATPase